jgi:hypothetical protein
MHSIHVVLISILPILPCMYGWALSIRNLLCHRLSVSDQRVQTHAFSDHFLWRTFRCFGWDCSPTLLWTLPELPPWRNPRDLPAQRIPRRRRHRWQCGGGGGDARVPRRCSRRGTRTCLPRQWCAARYVNAHLISAISAEPHMYWHGVCRPKQHLITFSDRSPGCFGWHSSPSQCCSSRSVNVHLISAIHILYPPCEVHSIT